MKKPNAPKVSHSVSNALLTVLITIAPKYRRITLPVVLLCLAMLTAKAQSWVNLNAPESPYSTFDNVPIIFLAVDLHNIIYAAYSDANNAVTVIQYNGTTWDTLGPADFASATNSTNFSMAIAPDNTPYIAFTDNNNNLKVMKYSGGNWISVGNSLAAAINYYPVQLAINGNGIPYVAYLDHSSILQVLKYANGSWQSIGPAGIYTPEETTLSLAIDNASGTCYVGFVNNNYHLAVIKVDNGSSQYLYNDTSNANTNSVQYIALSVDGSGNVYAAYSVYVNGFIDSVQEYENGGWVLLGSPGGGGAEGNIAIANTPSGIPLVVFESNTGISSAKYAGGSWVSLGTSIPASLVNGSSNDINIAIDNRGIPYTSFTQNSFPTVIPLEVFSYAGIITGNVGNNICAGTTISVPFTSSGTITFNAGNTFTAQLSDATGSFASPVNIGTLNSTAAGTISATVPAGTPAGTGYRIRVISSSPADTGSDNGSNLDIVSCGGSSRLWGLATIGGTSNSGTIFSLNGDGSDFAVNYNFGTVANSGTEPFNSLLQASNGLLYGTLSHGGLYGYGALFSYNPITHTYTDLFDFNGSNGSTPQGNLMQANNGLLYGMTNSGGTSYDGVLFSYNPATGAYSVLVNLSYSNGYNPSGASLLQASNGILYGLTQEGGANGDGTMFSYNPNTSTYTVLVNLNNTDGTHPISTLAQASNGLLYGFTNQGGNYSGGVLFSYDPNTSVYTSLYNMSHSSGDNPLFGSLVQASNGLLYGLTVNGGLNDLGTLFSYNINGNTYTSLLSFAGTTSGANPYSSVFQASDGLLYGTTEVGGANSGGVIFSYNTVTSAYTVLRNLSSADGYNPRGNLIEVFMPYITWTGNTSTDWNTATNWSTGTVPLATDSVMIPSSATNQPVISSNDTIYDITIASGATVTVAAGGTLTLNGTLLNSGAFTVQNGGGFLQGTGSTYSGAGTFNVQNKILNTSDGYRDLSSPVATTVADLANDFPVFGTNGVDCWYNYSPYPNVQVYNEALNNVGTANGNYYAGWVSYTGSANPLSPMLGVAVRNYPGGNPYTITLTGTPYNGAQTVAITNTPSGTSSQDGWNFVGNPYPSNIDWTAVAALNGNNITGAYYVFHTTGEYSGNWGTCNASGVCTGINGMNQYISPMQGFFVNAPSSGTFYMDNTVRTTSASGGFYAHGPLENEVRLKLSDDVNSDEIVSYTNPAATNGNDNGLDAEKIAAGSTVYMSYKLEGIEYAINVVNTITAQTELPLIISVADTGNYTLSAVALNVPGLTAYLKDTLHNTVTDLSTGNVTLALNGGQAYGNYEVVFKAVPVSGVANVAEGATTIYSYINHVTVERPTTDAATITVTNILGQQIATLESESNKTEFDLPAPSPWYAIVKVTEGEKVTVSKVFISK